MTTCQAGYTLSTVNESTICSVCLPGKYTPLQDGIECYSCPWGTYSDKEAAVSCTRCPSGTMNDEKGSLSASLCVEVPSPEPGDIVVTIRVSGKSTLILQLGSVVFIKAVKDACKQAQTIVITSITFVSNEISLAVRRQAASAVADIAFFVKVAESDFVAAISYLTPRTLGEAISKQGIPISVATLSLERILPSAENPSSLPQSESPSTLSQTVIAIIAVVSALVLLGVTIALFIFFSEDRQCFVWNQQQQEPHQESNAPMAIPYSSTAQVVWSQDVAINLQQQPNNFQAKQQHQASHPLPVYPETLYPETQQV